MITPVALLNSLRRAEEVLQKLGLSSVRPIQQCIDYVVQRRPHPPPTINVIFFAPNIIFLEKKKEEDVYCAAGEDVVQAKLREAEGAKGLLLEIVRRAAYDWVLYRNSTRPEQKQLADEAYAWLFEESESHPDYVVRKAERREFTSFLAICDVLDMDADRIRSYVRKLTPNRVVSGRQPTRRQPASAPSTRRTSSRKPVDYDDLILSMMDEEEEG